MVVTRRAQNKFCRMTTKAPKTDAEWLELFKIKDCFVKVGRLKTAKTDAEWLEFFKIKDCFVKVSRLKDARMYIL